MQADTRERDVSPNGGSAEADKPLLEGDAGFGRSAAAFERAFDEASTRACEIRIRLAGRPTRLRVAGEALAVHLLRAFAHLGDPGDAAPEFTIDLWDAAETGVAAPADKDVGERSWTAGGGVLTSGQGGRILRHRLGHSTLWLERRDQRMLGVVSSAGALSLHERGKPLHYLLSLWHNDRRTYVTHAGLVARESHGVLVAGPGGAGKSTTTAACVLKGFAYLGDDCVAIEARADGPFLGHSIYSAPWIERSHLRRFPELASYAVLKDDPAEDKAIVLLSERDPRCLARVAPIRAIVLPRIRPASTCAARPASRAEALLSLGPSSIVLFAPSSGAEGLRHLARLVASVPAYWLDVTPDLEAIPRAIGGLLDGLPG